MEHFINTLKGYAANLDQLQGSPRLAVISSVDPTTACARVLHQPEGILSGWLPILSAWTGDGWGMVCFPAVGDQVVVIAHDGDPANGVIVGALYSRKRKVPSCALGELHLIHSSGASIMLKNDGTVRITGDLYVSGDVFDHAGPMSRLRSAHNTHIHNDAVGRATSSPTTIDQ
jgi:phage baseplate assembly protein V